MATASDPRTLPFAWYSDEEQLRRERRRIFARSWQYGGRADQVTEPGSFLTTDAGGIPLLVTRSSDGDLRAFLNVCRHRGAILTEGCGRRETLPGAQDGPPHRSRRERRRSLSTRPPVWQVGQ